MADQTQNQTAPTPVSFDDVSLAHLTFNETFRVTRGAASQVVLGLKNMLTKLSSPTNDYQKSLYPQLSTLTQNVVTKYEETFLSVTESVKRQVYGANLNGHRNDGSLYRSVNSGVNRSLTYGYAQFGQLLKVLTSRLRFITNRDPQTVQRYKDSTEEAAAYVQLQTLSNEFLTYLSTVNDEWNRIVDTARTQHNIQKTKPVTRQYQPRQTQTDSQQESRKTQTHRDSRQQQHSRPPRQPRREGEQEWVTVRPSRPQHSHQHSHHRSRSEYATQKTASS